MRKVIAIICAFLSIGAALSDLDSLKLSVPIEQVIGPYVQLKKVGSELKGLCPFHSDKTPSFTVYTEGDKGGNYYCWGCHEHGDHFDFLQKMHNIEPAEAIKRVREMAGQNRIPKNWQRSAQTFSTPGEQKSPHAISLEDWQKTIDRLWGDSQEGQQGREFLQRRGISEETAKRFLLGVTYAQRIDQTSNCAWLGIPCVQDGKIAFVKWRATGEVPNEKRFRHEPGMDAKAVFNIETVDPLDDLYLTEGELDAITLEQAGFRAVSWGSAGQKVLPAAKDRMLHAVRLFVAGDNETKPGAAGPRAKERLLLDLGERAHNLIWPLKEGQTKKDANAFFLEDCEGKVDDFRRKVIALAGTAAQPKSPHFRHVRDWIEELRNSPPRLQDPSRLLAPWQSVERMALILPGDTVTLSAKYTGTGKSTFATEWIMHNVIAANKTAVFYTPDLKPRRHSHVICVQLSGCKRETLDERGFKAALGRMEGKFVYLGFDPDARNVDSSLDICEHAIRRLGADIFILDHIHYVVRNVKDGRVAQHIADAMSRMNGWAEKYGIINFVLGQPKKPEDRRAGDRPIELEDFKESETLVSDASAVIGLHRRRASPPSGDPGDSEGEIVLESKTMVRLLKGREMAGGAPVAWFTYDGPGARFYAISSQEPPPQGEPYG